MTKHLTKGKTALFLVAVCLAAAILGGAAQAAQAPIRVYLDGSRLGTTIDPVEQNGTTLVPFRSIFEALGLTVDWQAKTQTVTGQREGLTIKLTLGEAKATVNGEEKTLSVAPKTIRDNTMVPLRFVAEAASCKVDWDGQRRRVIIETPGYVPSGLPEVTIPMQHTDQPAYLEDLYTVDGSGEYEGYQQLKGYPGEDVFACYYKGDAQTRIVEMDDLRLLNPRLLIAWSYEGKGYKNNRGQLYAYFDDPAAMAAATGIDQSVLTADWFSQTFGAIYQEWVVAQQYQQDGEALVTAFLNK